MVPGLNNISELLFYWLNKKSPSTFRLKGYQK